MVVSCCASHTLRRTCVLCIRCYDLSGAAVRRRCTNDVPASTDGRCTRTDAVDADDRARQRGQRRRPGLPGAADVCSAANAARRPTASYRPGDGDRDRTCCVSANHLLVPEPTSVAADRAVLHSNHAADHRADEGPAAEHSDQRRAVLPRRPCRGTA